MGASSQLNWFCNFIVGLVFPYLNESLGPYSFAPFATVLAGTIVYAWFILPETQGKSPDELQQEMKKVLSQSVAYEPNENSASALDAEWRKAMEQLQQEEEQERQAGVSTLPLLCFELQCRYCRCVYRTYSHTFCRHTIMDSSTSSLKIL